MIDIEKANESGWVPQIRMIPLPSGNHVLQVYDWIGGSGTMPPLYKYCGVNGLVDKISEAVIIREHTEKLFWLSIKKIEDCLFSRRQGHKGKIIIGYSICLRLFGKDII